MSVWIPVNGAPFDRDLELGVVSPEGIDVVGYPCRRADVGWTSAAVNAPISLRPTHWRNWEEH
jgi:hypothetical protein